MADYELYVFELSDSVSSRRRIPAKRSSLPYVYVGYTSNGRRIRLKQHRIGWFSADRKWAPHYVRARPDLYRSWPIYFGEADALAGERQLAAALDHDGFTVVNKTGDRVTIRSQDADAY